jgi:hypothetical protein
MFGSTLQVEKAPNNSFKKDDHNPPRFHDRYGRHRAAIEIGSLRMLDGELPPRALGLVVEWAS